MRTTVKRKTTPPVVTEDKDISYAIDWYKKNKTEDELKAEFEKWAGMSFSGVSARNFLLAGSLAFIWNSGFKNEYILKKLESSRGKFNKTIETKEECKKVEKTNYNPKQYSFYAELESALDEFILNKCRSNKLFNLSELLNSLRPQKDELNYCRNKFQKKLIELKNSFTDKDLNEAYSFLTPQQKERLIEWYKNLILTCKTQRKPRKVKPSLLKEKKVKRVRLSSEDEYGFTSIPTEKLIESNAAIIWNSKRRLLSLFFAENGKTLDISGSAITNYDTNKSKMIKIRKPKETISKFLLARKDQIEKLFQTIKAKPKEASPYLNGKILLRVW